MTGRTTPRRDPYGDDELPSLRRRSPVVYWVAVIVLFGMVATLLASVVSAF